MSQERDYHRESVKAKIDVLKHIATLDTGAIVVVATFQGAAGRWASVAASSALFCFLVSAAFAGFGAWGYAHGLSYTSDRANSRAGEKESLGYSPGVRAVSGFAGGVFLLIVAFGLRALAV